MVCPLALTPPCWKRSIRSTERSRPLESTLIGWAPFGVGPASLEYGMAAWQEREAKEHRLGSRIGSGAVRPVALDIQVLLDLPSVACVVASDVANHGCHNGTAACS